MRIAYYAPLKSPTHGTPSGDRRVAGLLMDALSRAGHRVQLASTFRTYDGDGDAARQRALRAQGEALAAQYADEWRARAAAARPELWFTYHLYYKAPDYLGPAIGEALGIPYVVAEASYAAKRAHGAWALGHEATAAAIRKAALVIAPSRDDIGGLLQLVEAKRILYLPPFLDPAPYGAARAESARFRAELAAERKLDPAVPWIAVVAMMRTGDKLASYRVLAAALAQLTNVRYQLLVVGDGPARSEVERLFDQRASFFGALGQRRIAGLLGACDLYAWPSVNEAYGMALLEAQAAGVPVVAAATRGVPDIVRDGQTGTLVPYGDEDAFAAAVRELLLDAGRRAALGREAARHVAAERSLVVAAARLQSALAAL
ncbi:MAG TPA: glycosyltransferase family 4 protein [Burkholderiales bacterium]|nr:glycosyltransferase family 4 protein [Burkholderiales bacterium]